MAGIYDIEVTTIDGKSVKLEVGVLAKQVVGGDCVVCELRQSTDKVPARVIYFRACPLHGA